MLLEVSLAAVANVCKMMFNFQKVAVYWPLGTVSSRVYSGYLLYIGGLLIESHRPP